MDRLHNLLAEAIAAGASDVHLKAGAPPLFRVNRQLVTADLPPADADFIRQTLATILPAAGADPDMRAEIDFAWESGLGRFRGNAYRERGRQCIALRHVRSGIPGFEALNLPPLLRQIAEQPNGVVVVSGPSGTGKSTTLAAMIDHLNRTVRRRIITLEDPIEYVFADDRCMIVQREIAIDTASFDAGLPAALRQDPDVIMIGEMRDAPGCTTAIAAADTGHLVLTTLHTTDAQQTVLRLLDFFPAPERDQARRRLASSLRAVICQRLVPATSGGLLPAVEILLNTPPVRKLIEGDRIEALPDAIEAGRTDGMQTFNQSIEALLQEGRIRTEDALAYAGNPHALQMRLHGIKPGVETRILS